MAEFIFPRSGSHKIRIIYTEPRSATKFLLIGKVIDSRDEFYTWHGERVFCWFETGHEPTIPYMSAGVLIELMDFVGMKRMRDTDDWLDKEFWVDSAINSRGKAVCNMTALSADQS